jgi:hypothetical protein
LAESLVDRIVRGDCKDILIDSIDCLITDPATASPSWEKIGTGRFRVKSGGTVCGCAHQLTHTHKIPNDDGSNYDACTMRPLAHTHLKSRLCPHGS